MAKRQYSIRELIRMDARRGKRETEEQWRKRMTNLHAFLADQVQQIEKGANLDSPVFPQSEATKEETVAWRNLHAACLKFIEQRHRAGDSEPMTLYAFAIALHDYAKSDIAEQIDNEHDEAESVRPHHTLVHNDTLNALWARSGGADEVGKTAAQMRRQKAKRLVTKEIMEAHRKAERAAEAKSAAAGSK
jgi:hypothetical protein